MTVTAKEIIECVREMTAEERQELGRLIDPMPDIHFIDIENMSGLEIQDAVRKSLTEDQAKEVIKSCLT